ncbi:MAG: hypothetical protein J6K17_04080 [Oscillospiraceae bacterium]|nr:hypothetical protein [Oscillospiraceae bacterium]
MENTKSERNIVLRDRKTSVFARKKFTVKKNVRSVRDTDTANVPDGIKFTERGKSENPKAKTKSVLQKNNADKKRAKRAAYLKESMEWDIAASYAENYEEIPQETDNHTADENADNPIEDKEQFKSHFLGNTSFVSENVHKNSLDDENVRKAYKAKLAEKILGRRKETAEIRAQVQTNAVMLSAERAKAAAELSAKADIAVRDNVIPGAEIAAEYVSAVKSGDAAAMITQPAVSIVKKHLGGSGKVFDNISNAAGTVNSADSVGGAAASVGVNLAADKIKSELFESAFKPSDERIRERMEKKFYHIDRKAEKKIQKIEKRKEKISDGNVSEKELKKIEQSKEKYQKKLASQQKELQRNQQKKIFIKHNKNNPSFVGNKLAKKTVQKVGKGKLMLILGSGSGFFMVILIIIILLMIVASLFSWMTPYDYSLAGDESEEPTVEAKTNAEIIDGYALMIQNYMDVTQAYYYLVYGDWYGGVYAYPPPEEMLSFAEYFAEFQEKIIRDIQAKYEPLFAAATTPEQAQAIARAMSQEISAALSVAAEQARAEYEALMEELDDTMTSDERRLHYEVFNNGGTNGVRDSGEFTNRPIIGTNHFDDYEIDSEMSAEEMLALTALYKALKNMQEPEEDAEVVYNITPQDIMDLINDTEFITISAEITEGNSCSGNCKRMIMGDIESGYYWVYYCDNDHKNLNGAVEPCKTKEEMIEKILSLTNAEENGFDKDKCTEMYDEYIEVIKKELDVTESDYRKFGADDNERAMKFYEMLIDPNKGEIPNNYWTVNTPLPDDESEETEDEQT